MGHELGRNDVEFDPQSFVLEEAHERRILSWAPDPLDDELVEADAGPEPAAPTLVEDPRPAAPLETPAPLRVEPSNAAPLPAADIAPVTTVEVVAPVFQESPAASRARSGSAEAPTEEGPKKRGRPRGRPRRQVHFHVDPDEERLLLAAARRHGSQQKGLIAALQALQDNEVLRDEIERLRTECERQRVLLADAEAIFKR